MARNKRSKVNLEKAAKAAKPLPYEPPVVAGRAEPGRAAVMAVLAICLIWELIGRPLFRAIFPQVELPPSLLKEITGYLLPLLGIAG